MFGKLWSLFTISVNKTQQTFFQSVPMCFQTHSLKFIHGFNNSIRSITAPYKNPEMTVPLIHLYELVSLVATTLPTSSTSSSSSSFSSLPALRLQSLDCLWLEQTGQQWKSFRATGILHFISLVVFKTAKATRCETNLNNCRHNEFPFPGNIMPCT